MEVPVYSRNTTILLQNYLQQCSQSIPYEILSAHFVIHNWDISKFSNVKGVYDDIWKQRTHMEELAKKLNIKQLEDWYHVKWTTVQQHASIILHKYDDSPSKVLTTIFPEYPRYQNHVDHSCILR